MKKPQVGEIWVCIKEFSHFKIGCEIKITKIDYGWQGYTGISKIIEDHSGSYQCCEYYWMEEKLNKHFKCDDKLSAISYIIC